MIFETKFDMEDRVWLIRNQQVKVWIECKACGGTGKVVLCDDEPRSCPVCYGNCGKNEYHPSRWQVAERLTIGEIRIESRAEYSEGEDSDFDNFGHQKAKHEEVYMCRETGIGSGTLWQAENLFATREEAEAECEKRNAVEVPA